MLKTCLATVTLSPFHVSTCSLLNLKPKAYHSTAVSFDPRNRADTATEIVRSRLVCYLEEVTLSITLTVISLTKARHLAEVFVLIDIHELIKASRLWLLLLAWS